MTSSKRRGGTLAAAALTLTLFLGAACGDGSNDDEPASATTSAPTTTAASTDPTGAGQADGAEVKVALFRFQPATLEVPAGTTVTWRNDDQIVHTVTAGVPGAPADDFDEELADKGSTASVKFDEPGSYKYFCARHPEAMRAEVTVK